MVHGAGQTLLDLFKRSNVQSIPAGSRITGLAGTIRDYYQVRRDENDGRGISTPDAIHLATAIHSRATAFYTFDKDGDKQFLGLIPLSGNVAGHPLLICKPKADEPEFNFEVP